LQATGVAIEEWNGYITIFPIYPSLKHVIESEQYINIFKALGNCFIAADNIKHMHEYDWM